MVSLIGLTLKFYETCEWSCLQSIGLKRKLLSTCGLELKQEWSRPGVDFIKVGRKAQIIDIVLWKLGAPRKARSTPQKSFSKVGSRAQEILWNQPQIQDWCKGEPIIVHIHWHLGHLKNTYLGNIGGRCLNGRMKHWHCSILWTTSLWINEKQDIWNRLFVFDK